MSKHDDVERTQGKSSRKKVLGVVVTVLLGILGLIGFQAGWNREVGWYLGLASWTWTSVGNHMQHAFTAMDAGDFDEAEKHLRAVEAFVSANPDDPSTSKSHDAGQYDIPEVVHYNLGKIYELRGDVGQAVKEYKAARLSCRPNTAACDIYSSQANALEGKVQDAVENLEKALKLEPENVLAHNNLGFILLKSGDYVRALPHNEKAYSMRVDQNTTRNLASNYRALGKNSAAEGVLQNALMISEKTFGKNHPLVAIYALELAEVYHDDQQKPEAELLYRLALEIAEKDQGRDSAKVAEILNDLGYFYVLQKKVQRG